MNHVLIGVGGVGTHLVNGLARYMYSERSTDILLLVDGDVVENHNLSRQDFGIDSIGVNKAEATRERLRNLFPGLRIDILDEFLTPENVGVIVQDQNVVFLGVDNYATRKIVNDHAQDLSDITLISGGNELTDGDVIVYHRSDGSDLTNPLDLLHPEIGSPTDVLPTELNCQEMAESEPQLIFTNMMVANLMLIAYWHLREKGGFHFHELFFDINSGKMRTRPVAKKDDA